VSNRHEIRPFKVEFNSEEEYQEFINWAEGKKKTPSERKEELKRKFRAYKAKKMVDGLKSLGELGVKWKSENFKEYEDEDGNIDWKHVIQDIEYQNLKGDD